MSGASPTKPDPFAAPAVRIEATLAPRLNLADFQNAVPLIRELVLVNEGSNDLRDLDLDLSAEPPFLESRLWRIDLLRAGQRLQLTDIRIRLDGPLFSRLSEAEQATVLLTLSPGSASGPVAAPTDPPGPRSTTSTEPTDSPELAALPIARSLGPAPTPFATARHAVDLLARDQWGGHGSMPEMLAAFVQPNEAYVEQLLRSAVNTLEKEGHSPSLNGYTLGPKHAWAMASAIWSAIGNERIAYAFPPASFEQSGQKCRGPARIADSKLGTCLDLTLLFAATLEQAGLNPLLVLERGHAYVGVWLTDESFQTVVTEDVSALRKRIKLKELIVFESTLVTGRPPSSFGFAIKSARQRLSEAGEDAFELCIDVRRARLQRIRPLASQSSQSSRPGPSGGADEGSIFAEGSDAAADETVRRPVAFEAPDDDDLPDADPSAPIDPANETPADRLTRWQRKLLDLSTRNSLLSFRSRKAVVLEAPDPEQLEDLLAAGHSLKLLPRTDLMEGRDPRSRAIHDEREQEDSRRQRALDALARKEVFLTLDAGAMEATLVDLFRTARSTLQEGGSNTLYLAFGFLVWSRDKVDGRTDLKTIRRYRAPLLMLPVTLERRSARSGFSLSAYDDAPQFNPTLLEMLRQDFRLELGIQAGELVVDEGSLDVTGLLRKVAQGIKNIPGWEVSDEVVLSTFSFAKYLMWKDLRDRADALRQSPVVRHLIDNPRAAFPSDTPFPEPRRLDVDLPPQATFCPLPHDSSQLAAVVAAVRGKDFVLIGPPGTGKSQTIANLIAQCLAERKRVLFVSEKMAALDVVYRRLRDVGLGEFCLELHSSKARKTEVLGQLKTAWEARGEVDPEAWQARADELADLRARLNGYVERLHHRHRNGLSAFDAIGQVTRHPDSPALNLAWPSPDVHDVRALQGLRDLATELDTQLQPIAELGVRSNALSHVRHTGWSARLTSDLRAAATALIGASDAVDRTARHFVDAAGLPALTLSRPTCSTLERLAKILPHAFQRNWRFMLRADAEAVAAALARAAIHLKAWHDAKDRLPVPWSRETLDRVQAGLRMLTTRRELVAALSRPWPEAVCAEVETAAARVADYRQHEAQLSVRYRPEALQLELKRLREDWAASQTGIWPFKALKRKSVEKALGAVTVDEATPTDFGVDLDHLARMRACRSDLAAAESLATATGGLWQGLTTDLDRLLAARRCQLALAHALKGQPWQDEGLEAVADGQCGEAMAIDLKRLRELARLEADVGKLAALTDPTEGVWNGLSTDPDLADAVMRLNLAVHAARDGRDWNDEGFGPIDASRAGLEATATLAILRSQKAEAAQLAALERLEDLAARSEGLWQGLATALAETDLAARACKPLRQAVRVLGQARASGPSVASDPASPADAVERAIARLLDDDGGNAGLGPTGDITRAARDLRETWEPYENAIGRYRSLWEPASAESAATAAGTEPAGPDAAGTGAAVTPAAGEARASVPTDMAARLVDLPPAELAAHCRAFLNRLPQLHQWCGWLKSRDQALAAGLAPLVAAIETGTVEPGRSREVFEVAYCRWWLERTIDDDDVLRTFLSHQHERRIDDFRRLGDTFTDLTRQWVRARLCADIPAAESLNLGSRHAEWGLLNREFQKKHAHLPLRELMSRTPTAVATLTPCLLMSPLSVAQYLPPDTDLFDVVVFDEASQIPVWDAVGAMARGRQVIMVGDPKQLPPTNFFGRAEADDDEGDFDIESDMESVLDECLAASIPKHPLDWHYRSRHESLIAFSNRQYYENRLITFPSPVTDDRAVGFHRVANGIYEKGSARTNPIEARALVDDLVGRLKAPGFRESGMTIGVVTFNSQQQGLIEDLLDAARRDDPALEHYFQESLLEPIFVKNLENVQGDERDIIYFSLTYGPTVSGTISMNFGPLNKTGGERRLNVAVTRARQALRVFSSLRPDQIDLSRTQAIGVKHLKHFMEFAERGPRAFAEAVSGSIGGFESPFEEAVSIALTAKGWQVHPQIGVSGFRIDLGIVEEDAPGSYLAGVECDGASYHRSATAQDRDKVREQVLKGLGWDLVRIWSTDWWQDPVGTAERVDGRLRGLLAERREARAVAENAAAAAAAAATEPKAPAVYATADTTADEADPASMPLETGAMPARPTSADRTEVSPQTILTVPTGDAERLPVPDGIYARGPLYAPRSQVPVFREVDFAKASVAPDPASFHDPRYDVALAELIDQTVRQEGPILERTLSRRIARAHGWLRTGRKIQDRVMAVALVRQRHDQDGDERCFWPEGTDARNCRYRHPPTGEAREIDEVPRAELVALAREIAGSRSEFAVEQGVEAMLEQLGLKRARAATRQRLAGIWRESVEVGAASGARPMQRPGAEANQELDV